MTSGTVSVQCCIAGGGPAGMMLGFLLARAGVEVLVLEKHADFLRDFRGDTIHPSTLEVMHELGLLDDFLKLPHQRVHQLSARFGEHEAPLADFSHLPVRCPFVVFIPQWDFLKFLAERVGEIRSWDDVKLLTVRVDRLRRWYRPGLLCIGDAAHAMSPVGGVGINLAIQDAVAAANVLAVPLRDGMLATRHLARVQRRRELPTRVTQRLQIVMQRRVIARVLESRGAPLRLPLALRLFARYPVLRRIPARLIGIGVRPEHVQSPSVPAASRGADALSGGGG